MLGQRELRCLGVRDMLDLPLQLTHAVADRLGERHIVLHQQQMQSDLQPRAILARGQHARRSLGLLLRSSP